LDQTRNLHTSSNFTMNLHTMQHLLALALASAPTVRAKFWGRPKETFPAPHEVHQFEQVKFHEEDQWDCRTDAIAGVTGCLACKSTKEEALLVEVQSIYKRADANINNAPTRKHCIFPGQGEFYTCFNSNLVIEPDSAWLKPYSDKPIYATDGKEYDADGKAGTKCLPMCHSVFKDPNAKPETLASFLDGVSAHCAAPVGTFLYGAHTHDTTGNPSPQRRKELEETYGGKFNFTEIIDENKYAATFDAKSYKGSGLIKDGIVSDMGCDDHRIRFEGTEAVGAVEANLMCASECEHETCDYFEIKSVTFDNTPDHLPPFTQVRTLHECSFYKEDEEVVRKTKQMFPVYLEKALQVWDYSIISRVSSEVEIPLFDDVACNVNTQEIKTAIPCLFRLRMAGNHVPSAVAATGYVQATCDPLLTDDFKEHVAPAFICLGQNSVDRCMTCLSAAFGDTCGKKDVCEPDKGKNSLSINGTGVGVEMNDDGVVGCAIDCKNDEGKYPHEDGGCFAQLQSAFLCNLGASTVKTPTRMEGGCINKNIPGEDKVLTNNFTCDGLYD